MRTRFSLITSFLLPLTFLSSSAFANFSCVTNVNKVLIYNDGGVNVYHTGRNDFTVICSLQSERQNIGITTCAMWTSMLQNAQAKDIQVAFYYPGEGSCATLPTYGATQAPIYIGVVK